MSDTTPRTQPSTLRRILPYLYFLGLVWLNFYIIRGLLAVETTARMNSMHGFWTALARLGDGSWWTPSWWRYWDGGMPFEYAYAPLVPGLTALVAKAFGIPQIRAVEWVFALILTLGPPLLYLGVWRLTRAPGWSFAAAAFYSLLSPALVLAPNDAFSLRTLFYLERFFLTIEWDEGPHLAALALWGPAVLCLFRIVETRRLIWIAAGVPLLAGMVYASAFGTTVLAITAVCVLGAVGFSWERFGSLAVAGALTYLAAMAWLPPSFVRVIREASDFHGQGWTWSSWTALAIVVFAWVLVYPRLMRRMDDSRLRFFILFAMTSLLIVWLNDFLHKQFVPQPVRYKQELAIGLSLAAVFSFRLVWGRLSRPVQAATLGLVLAVAAEQTVFARRWAKELIQDRDVTSTIEYRAAQAVDRYVPPEGRVMLPGSIAQWLNAFSRHEQWSGSSWSSAPNLKQQAAREEAYSEAGGFETSLMWFRAFGVDAVVTVGPDSPEFWKPFRDPGKYEGHFEKLWSERDTALYIAPRRIRSRAHALPDAVRATGSRESVKAYVAALESERLPGLTFHWAGRNSARVEGEVLGGEAVSLQMNDHPGWSARVGGREVEIEPDGLGLMWIRPGCNGPCAIDLEYTGGFELHLARWISMLTLVGMAGLFAWDWRRKPH
jgi:hypothetical protein